MKKKDCRMIDLSLLIDYSLGSNSFRSRVPKIIEFNEQKELY